LADAEGRSVRILIGKPRRYRGGHADYYCPFSINGVENEIRYAGGVDAIQALQLVMKAIGIQLSQSGRSLRWDAGQGIADLGFPGMETDDRPSGQIEKAMTRVFAEAFGNRSRRVGLELNGPRDAATIGHGRTRM
jgi:hypothetical protein